MFNLPPKSFPHSGSEFFMKKAAFGLILMAENPKEIRQKAARQKLPTLPAPFEGNVLKESPHPPNPQCRSAKM
jgi:hypothetical protein